MDSHKPTQEQLIALHQFAREHGRTWKSALRECWFNGIYPNDCDSASLQQVRNQLGPSWLVRFRLTPGETWTSVGTRPYVETCDYCAVIENHTGRRHCPIHAEQPAARVEEGSAASYFDKWRKGQCELPTDPIDRARVLECRCDEDMAKDRYQEQADSRERCICGELLPCDHLAVDETGKVVR